jgi:type II secretory pathway component PulL
MGKLKRYVLSGSFDKHTEQGVRWLTWVSWALIILAVVVFAPVVVRIIGGKG